MLEHKELVVIAGLLVALMALGMLAGHEHHYKDRRWTHLDNRLKSLETMYLEDRRS